MIIYKARAPNIGEGNGNLLQCSCLENPRDGGAWWAAVYVVAQSRTRLKWLSSMPLCKGQEGIELCCCCCCCQHIGLPAGIQLLIQVWDGPVGLCGQSYRWIDPFLGSWFWSLAWDSQGFIAISGVDRSDCPGMPLILRRTGMDLGFAATTNPSGSVHQ